MQNYTIPAINLGYLKHRIEQLNKRAAKLGLPIIEMKVLGTIMKEVGEAGVPRRFFEISMDGVAPKLPGWTFLGTLEHTDHGNILRSVPGSEIPESYRNAPRKCDHCQKVRNRKDTYVVRNEEAEALTRMKTGLFGHNFIGHSHLTTTYQYNGRKVKDVTGEYSYNPAYKYLFNVGSVGQPRDRNPEACFVMFDTDSKSVRHLRVAYDIERAAARIREVGHDEKFARRLSMGV